MPTVVNGYCATTDVRSQLGDEGQVLDETLLVRAVNATSRAIDDYCSDGVPFGSGGRRFWRDASVTTTARRGWRRGGGTATGPAGCR